MRFEAIFFDFDGVIAESEQIKTDAFRVVYADQPPDMLARIIAYHKANAGISRVVKIAHIEREFLHRAEDKVRNQALAQIYADTVVDKVIAAPDVAGAREFLQAHQGRLPMFIISGTPEVELRPIVDARALTDYFDAVRGSPDLKPVIGRDLAARFGLDVSKVVFIGDAPTDYQAAQDLGCAFVGRVQPGQVDPFPTGTTIVPDLTDLAAVLA